MKIFMLHSLVPGIRYYRLMAPAKYLSKVLHHDIYFEDTSFDGLSMSAWQERALDPNFHEMLEHMLPGIDLLVTQLVHSQQGMAVLQGIKHHFQIPIVLDVDDNLEIIPSYNKAGVAYQPDSELSSIIMELMGFVDAITVSTEYLKGVYQKYNKSIHVLPNSMDFEHWGKAVEMPEKRSLRIGWAGAQTHEDDIKMILPALEQILKLYPNVRLYFVGGVPECVRSWKHKRVIQKFGWYDILDYPKRLKQYSFDIGIAPLLDNEFNRSKSNLRWLEYSAMGIPSVVSRVEPFNRTVEDGKTGLFAYEIDEWVAQLSRLIESEELRRKIGRAAYRKVKSDFNIEKNCSLWEAVYKELVTAKAGV